MVAWGPGTHPGGRGTPLGSFIFWPRFGPYPLLPTHPQVQLIAAINLTTTLLLYSVPSLYPLFIADGFRNPFGFLLSGLPAPPEIFEGQRPGI